MDNEELQDLFNDLRATRDIAAAGLVIIGLGLALAGAVFYCFPILINDESIEKARAILSPILVVGLYLGFIFAGSQLIVRD